MPIFESCESMPGGANFLDVINIGVKLIKFFKTQVEKLQLNFYLYCQYNKNWILLKIVISTEKYGCQDNSRVVSCELYIFWIFFSKGITEFLSMCEIHKSILACKKILIIQHPIFEILPSCYFPYFWVWLVPPAYTQLNYIYLVIPN